MSLTITPQFVHVGTTRGTSTTFPPAHVVVGWRPGRSAWKQKVLCRKMPIWVGTPWLTTVAAVDCRRCLSRLALGEAVQW